MTFFTSSAVRARAVDHLAVAIGTTKGLYFVSDGVVDGPFMPGKAVLAFAQLPGRMLATSTDSHFGPNVRVSEDGGLSWDDAGARPVAFPPDTDTALTSVWQLHVDRRPNGGRTVWAGVEPAALFRSDDGGETFELVRGLWDHPDRTSWQPGFGGLCLHTVVTHRERPDRIVVAVSAGGVYRSDDGGRTWAARNVGIEARFLPEPYPDHGQCVHKLAVDAVNPDVLWAQNHWGIYRSGDAGDHWESLGRPGERGGVSSDFGFPVVSHPRTIDTAFVIPLESDAHRVTPGGRCRVYRTMDGGRSWEPLVDGLPSENAYVTVLRDAFDVGKTPPFPLVFGTRSGHVFASQDGGDSWRNVASFLPPILCVRVLE